MKQSLSLLKSQSNLACIETPYDFKYRKGLTFLHLNIRSLLPEIDHVKMWVSQADPDIFIVSETWLTDETLDSDVSMDGYNVFRADRNGKDGGVAIYTRNILCLC
jgi:exonuclease III